MLPRAAAHWRVLTDSGEAILHDVQLGNKQNLEKRRGVNETEAVAAFRGRIPPLFGCLYLQAKGGNIQ